MYNTKIESRTYRPTDLRPGAKQRLKPEDVRPFPSAPPRKPEGKRSRLGKTRILTDTPVKNEIVFRQTLKLQVKEKKSIRQKRRTSKAVENVSSKKKTHLDQRHRSEIVVEQCKPASTKKSRKRILPCYGRRKQAPKTQKMILSFFWHPGVSSHVLGAYLFFYHYSTSQGKSGRKKQVTFILPIAMAIRSNCYFTGK